MKSVVRSNIAFALVALLCIGTVWGQAALDLGSARLEDLMEIEVAVVSKKPQKLAKTPAAVYVITQQEIKRSGLSSLPELLRLVPGFHVARIDANKWAISARGFNGRFSDQLLVMVDRRTVYTPIYAGVFWDMQDFVLEDIDRIEVIRGPGGAVWGANAVNGVVNIVTKRAAQTQGGLVSIEGGNRDRFTGSMRWGGQAGRKGHYRVYGKGVDRSGYSFQDGSPAGNAWRGGRGGFRLDLSPTDRDSLTLSGEMAENRQGTTYFHPSLRPPFFERLDARDRTTSGFLMGRWERSLRGASSLAVNAFHQETDLGNQLLNHRDKMTDIDVVHRMTGGERHEIAWGAGFRSWTSQVRPGGRAGLAPAQRTDPLGTAFMQDEIALVPDRMTLSVGTKIERNNYTGVEVQPSIRLMANPRKGQAFWAAISRSVSTPSRLDSDATATLSIIPTPAGLPGVIQFLGKEGLQVESQRSAEIGYRAELGPQVEVDWTAFYNHYVGLTALEPQRERVQFQPFPHILLPLQNANSMNGESLGTEVAMHYSPTGWWRVTGTYSWLSVHLQHRPFPRWEYAENAEGASPRHQGSVRSYIDLPRGFQLDASLYSVGELATNSVRRYVRGDLRLGWEPRPGWELSVQGQNLLGGSHLEFITEEPFLRPVWIQRGITIRLGRRF